MVPHWPKCQILLPSSRIPMPLSSLSRHYTATLGHNSFYTTEIRYHVRFTASASDYALKLPQWETCLIMRPEHSLMEIFALKISCLAHEMARISAGSLIGKILGWGTG